MEVGHDEALKLSGKTSVNDVSGPQVIRVRPRGKHWYTSAILAFAPTCHQAFPTPWKWHAIVPAQIGCSVFCPTISFKQDEKCLYYVVTTNSHHKFSIPIFHNFGELRNGVFVAAVVVGASQV